MDPTTRFLFELDRLEQLHLGTVFAYQQTRVRLRHKLSVNAVTLEDAVVANLRGFPVGVAVSPSVRRLRGNLKVGFQRQLRELVLVRSVSALEEWLVRVVREIFVVRPELFKTEVELRLTAAQLLTLGSTGAIRTIIINKETRQLHSGGFQQIARFYRERLGIDFSEFDPNLRRLSELHDRRHLLVHRLGRTDAKYRKTYGVATKQLEVGRTYLAKTLTVLREFAQFIVQAKRPLLRKIARRRPEPTARARIVVRSRTQKGKDGIRPTYAFEHDEELISLQELIIERSLDGSGHLNMLLEGDVHVLRNYCSQLRRLASRGSVDELNIEFKRLGRGRTEGRFEQFVGQVAAATPIEPPLPEGMKRELAERFGTSLVRVSRAMEDISLAKRVARWLSDRPIYSGIHRELAESFDLDQQKAYRLISRLRQGVYGNHARLASPVIGTRVGEQDQNAPPGD